MMQSSTQSGEKNKVKTKVKQTVKMHTLLLINSQLGDKYASFESNNVKILLTSSS